MRASRAPRPAPALRSTRIPPRQRAARPPAWGQRLASGALLSPARLHGLPSPLACAALRCVPQLVVGVIALCTLIFLPTFISILAVFTVVCIDLQLMAVMSLAGLNFNSISCISLLIALG
jgi:hypothetical protein